MEETKTPPEFRPRVLTSFTSVHLEDIQERFGEAKKLRQLGEHPEDLIGRLEPDNKKRERFKTGIAVLGQLKEMNISLDRVKEVLVWSTPKTETLGEVRLEIKQKPVKPKTSFRPRRF